MSMDGWDDRRVALLERKVAELEETILRVAQSMGEKIDKPDCPQCGRTGCIAVELRQPLVQPDPQASVVVQAQVVPCPDYSCSFKLRAAR